MMGSGNNGKERGKSQTNWFFPHFSALLFLLVLFIPAVLGIFSQAFGLPADAALNGYVDEVEKPVLTWSSFTDRSFQDHFSDWFESSFKPVGVLTKAYSTIRYTLFNLGGKTITIGKNKSVFEQGYIDAELCINEFVDLREAKYREEMKAYVEKLVLLREKLRCFGKELYIYVAASKANYDRANIPDKYLNIAEDGSIKASAYYMYLLEEYGLPHLDYSEVSFPAEYPTFYPTGIHWSRPFEQQVNIKIIQDLSALTGRRYRNTILHEIEESSSPFWRDTDIFDLLNVWNKPNLTFYQYRVERESPDSYDKLRLLVQGDSFLEGFMYDVKMIYPNEDIYFFSRASCVQDLKYDLYKISSWEDIPLADYLNSVDAVMLEVTEAEVRYFSYGFVDYLLDFLDSYTPGDRMVNTYCSTEDIQANTSQFYTSQRGLYIQDQQPTWTKPVFGLFLDDPKIREDGLELEFSVPQYLFRENEDVTVEIYINETKQRVIQFSEPWSGSIVLDCTDCIDEQDNLCRLEVSVSTSFTPQKLGLNDDERVLSLEVFYMGSARV